MAISRASSFFSSVTPLKKSVKILNYQDEKTQTLRAARGVSTQSVYDLYTHAPLDLNLNSDNSKTSTLDVQCISQVRSHTGQLRS